MSTVACACEECPCTNLAFGDEHAICIDCANGDHEEQEDEPT